MPISRLEAFKFWLKLGFISFGGPAGQIAVMHRELVQNKRWISEDRFLHALNYCMLLPGPEAQQLATYLGWLMHRSWGGIVAGTLFVLPSLFILLGLSWLYVLFGSLPWLAGLLYGIKPAVAALVVQAVHRIGSRTLKQPKQAPLLWAVAVLSFVAISFLNVPFPAVVLAAALTGWLGSRWLPGQFAGRVTPTTGPQASEHGANAAPPAGQALINHNTPRPAHTRYTPARLARVLLIGLGLWLLPMGLLVAWQGWHGALAQMGWFFTKAALLTFGGAYAVLPYVYQGAVEQFGWLSAAQMMDGLALGETTPGPLIMVVAFVGFLGGWSQQVLGPTHLLGGAALAAIVVTWFTFLPSFIFILAGGPLVESTHGKLHFTAPLAAITAAVVGVVASLAVFFIAHIAYPSGAAGTGWSRLDPVAIGLTLAAGLALLRYRRSLAEVMAACALAGLAAKLLGWA
jgi:chromate transporter